MKRTLALILAAILAAAALAGCAGVSHTATGAEADGVLERQRFSVLEHIVLAAAAGRRGDRLRKFAVFGDQIPQTFVAVVTSIHVERHKAALFAHRDANVGKGRLVPPTGDFSGIGRRLIAPILNAGMFSRCPAHRTKPAGATSVGF